MTGWQKSSFSGGTTGNECLETVIGAGRIRIRESSDPGVVVTTTPGSLRALIRGIKEGEFERLG
ncbi:DUF397 domain-containing protein [Streptomyces xinghaiensis]|uniref:DUF397 domain-containing protein n=1 Tax=Streptomyces xinghaiensis TaxID=1038928 RepID=UPI00030DBC1D|nr:DUF397 domain-containing protein [Streptomyces xinghaiensis]MZE75892.1 DUF397 domain-containing protein [Streptomyces sp. SID5475]